MKNELLVKFPDKHWSYLLELAELLGVTKTEVTRRAILELYRREMKEHQHIKETKEVEINEPTVIPNVNE